MEYLSVQWDPSRFKYVRSFCFRGPWSHSAVVWDSLSPTFSGLHPPACLGLHGSPSETPLILPSFRATFEFSV